MKQFNLKEYLENPNRKVVTRDGRPVRIICTDRKSNISYDGPILALVDEIKEEREYCYAYSSDGKAYESESDIDLFFAPNNKEGWMNVFKFREATSVAAGGVIYESEQAAKKAKESNQNYITTIKIEWEED